MQLRRDAFEESRLIMTFLANSGVTRLLFSFRSVLEDKSSKKVSASSRFEFLEKFFTASLTLLEAENSNSHLLKRGGIADLTF